MEDSTLRTSNLVKSYQSRVVDGVCLEIHRGEIVGLLGPNGAGKTTTFYMIVGLVRSDSGGVFLGSRELTNLPMHIRAGCGIGYLSQEPSVFQQLTVRENIMAILETVFPSSKEREKRLKGLLGELSISSLSNQKAYTLSGGERRRVEIARALVNSPSFLLLDEPFTGIDPIALADIQQIIFELKKKNYGVLITDHNVRETLEIVDRAYIMHGGKVLFSGTAGELIQNSEARRVYLGERFNEVREK